MWDVRSNRNNSFFFLAASTDVAQAQNVCQRYSVCHWPSYSTNRAQMAPSTRLRQGRHYVLTSDNRRLKWAPFHVNRSRHSGCYRRTRFEGDNNSEFVFLPTDQRASVDFKRGFRRRLSKTRTAFGLNFGGTR